MPTFNAEKDRIYEVQIKVVMMWAMGRGKQGSIVGECGLVETKLKRLMDFCEELGLWIANS